MKKYRSFTGDILEKIFSCKIYKIMRNTLILLLITVIQAYAIDSYSQNTRLTLNLDDVKVASVIEEIEKQSDFYFLFNAKLIDVERKVSLSAKDEKISDILSSLFSGTGINHLVYDKQIILTPSEAKNMAATVQQQRQVTGTITETISGQPMAGVTVLVKGTTVGTITDFSGKFSLNVPDPANNILVLSFVGFTAKEVPIAGRSVVDITLDEELTGLDEVVVIGYGTARRSDLVGATSSISTKDVINQPAARVDQVLQGRSPGIAIQNNSAAPNGSFTIRIRGSNSLSGSNDPLVVIDGFIGGDLSSLNPNDISNIEVLKDASSTAIYGSRGANGVILVTTKKGASNRTVVEYNGFTNFQQISKKMDQLNAAEYAETVNANRIDIGRPTVFTQEQIDGFRANGGTDWQDVVFRKSLQQSHQISVSGGTDKNTYYISGNYSNNEGIIRGSSFNQYSVRSNMESEIGAKSKVGLNLYFSRSEDHPVITGGSQDQSPTQGALIWAPTKPVYQEDGMTYTRPGGGYGPPAVNNPLAMAIEPINDNIALRGEINSFFNYNIIKGLTARVIVGARMVDQENSQYLNNKPSGGLADAVAAVRTSRFLVLQNTNQINYQTKIANIHDINITAVYEQQREDFNNAFAGANGFSSDATTYNNLGLGSKPQPPTSNQSRKDIQSIVGRANYSYMDKYLFSFTSRYDGASVFGTQKWGFFPSAALAWRVTGEEFMSQFSSINNLKLRSSYGVTGSQAISPYTSLSKLNTNGPYPINGSTASIGIGLGTLGNPDLRWEKTTQLNIGIDLGLFKGRIVFNADYYNKNTSDLLMSVPLPRISGYTNILRNIGKVQNSGFELNLGGDPLNGEIRWNTNLNFAMNKNEVKALSGPSEIALAGTGFPNMGNTIFLEIGQPMGLLRGYIQNGTWGTAEIEEATSFGSVPGAPKYVDQNGDGRITSADIVNMGTTLPKFTYGWSNSVNYKNFDLNILIQGSQGNKVYNLTRIRSERTSSDADATDRRILNRWTPDNQNTSVPSFLGSNAYEQLQSSRWLEDGSYLRFKNITLGYNLSKDLLTRVKISSARIFLSGVNLFTITEYTGYDPEASTNVGTMGGIDMAPYPSQKMYTIGVNLKF
jgi:TonB-dependent starch-binding outer membrane protein SusC